MIDISLYEKKDRVEWDDFIARAKNSVFLYYRGYMDYHADRFTDHSLMFRKNGVLVGLMPANISDNVLVSHGGLSFGGVVSDKKMTTPLMLELFKGMTAYLSREGIEKLIYKCVPHIYHEIPAEEDRYALFLHNARLYRRDVTTTVPIENRIAFQERRRRAISGAKKAGLTVSRSFRYGDFLSLLAGILETKYKTKPVHTAGELELLAGRFPDNIKLFSAERDGTILAAVVVYENRSVAHAQYIAASEEGKALGALDLVFDFLISDHYQDKRYFDFGISTEDNGRYLNKGLIEQKEGFGGRAVAFDFYEMEL